LGAISHADAWTMFWQCQSPEHGCCARTPEIECSLDGHWSAIGRMWKRGGKLIDLACGSGSVGRMLLSTSPAIQMTGVDFATVPASLDSRLTILPNVRMEQLPFPDAAFDAAVSQFGFEYGEVEICSRELARVLRPGAPFSFLVHHAGSRIVSDGRSHRRALERICEPEVKAAFQSGDVMRLERILAGLCREFAHERIVGDAAQGLRRVMKQDPPVREQIWRAVEAALSPELTMSAELEKCAVRPDQLESWLKPLANRFDLAEPTLLRMTGGLPLCWVIGGKRRPTLR